MNFVVKGLKGLLEGVRGNNENQSSRVQQRRGDMNRPFGPQSQSSCSSKNAPLTSRQTNQVSSKPTTGSQKTKDQPTENELFYTAIEDFDLDTVNPPVEKDWLAYIRECIQNAIKGKDSRTLESLQQQLKQVLEVGEQESIKEYVIAVMFKQLAARTCTRPHNPAAVIIQLLPHLKDDMPLRDATLGGLVDLALSQGKNNFAVFLLLLIQDAVQAYLVQERIQEATKGKPRCSFLRPELLEVLWQQDKEMRNQAFLKLTSLLADQEVPPYEIIMALPFMIIEDSSKQECAGEEVKKLLKKQGLDQKPFYEFINYGKLLQAFNTIKDEDDHKISLSTFYNAFLCLVEGPKAPETTPDKAIAYIRFVMQAYPPEKEARAYKTIAEELELLLGSRAYGLSCGFYRLCIEKVLTELAVMTLQKETNLCDGNLRTRKKAAQWILSDKINTAEARTSASKRLEEEYANQALQEQHPEYKPTLCAEDSQEDNTLLQSTVWERPKVIKKSIRNEASKPAFLDFEATEVSLQNTTLWSKPKEASPTDSILLASPSNIEPVDSSAGWGYYNPFSYFYSPKEPSE